MFYFEYILYFVISISFIIHLIKKKAYLFLTYNIAPIVFGFLSLNSIYDFTKKYAAYDIYQFIMNDELGVWMHVVLFLVVFVLCILIICFNSYFILKYDEELTG